MGITTRFGKPAADARKVALILRMRDHEMGDTELVLSARPDGQFAAGSGVASMGGTFDIEAVIRQDGRDDIRVPYLIDLDVAPMPTPSPREGLHKARFASSARQVTGNRCPWGSSSPVFALKPASRRPPEGLPGLGAC